MLILIAESKTMSNPLPVNDSDAFDNHCPLTQDRVEELISSWRELTVDQLAGAIKISPALARSMKLMIHDFPDKSRMSPAIEAYTGVVFKALDFKSLSEEAKQNAVARVRIISSLYGYLRPDDLIKPYRLDFTTVMTPPAIMMSRYWHSVFFRFYFRAPPALIPFSTSFHNPLLMICTMSNTISPSEAFRFISMVADNLAGLS